MLHTSNADLFTGEASTTPLINAMIFGNFLIGRHFLDAQADAKCTTGFFGDAFMASAMCGRSANIEELDRADASLGSKALLWASALSADGAEATV